MSKMTEAKKVRKKYVDEPIQSDATLLLKVEDLIHIAMGPADQNVVNFKMVEQILYILCRQMRMLDQKVEVRLADYSQTGPGEDGARHGGRAKHEPSDESTTSEETKLLEELEKDEKVKDKKKKEAKGKADTSDDQKSSPDEATPRAQKGQKSKKGEKGTAESPEQAATEAKSDRSDKTKKGKSGKEERIGGGKGKDISDSEEEIRGKDGKKGRGKDKSEDRKKDRDRSGKDRDEDAGEGQSEKIKGSRKSTGGKDGKSLETKTEKESTDGKSGKGLDTKTEEEQTDGRGGKGGKGLDTKSEKESTDGKGGKGVDTKTDKGGRKTKSGKGTIAESSDEEVGSTIEPSTASKAGKSTDKKQKQEAEKGSISGQRSAAGGPPIRIGSIEVVTQKQFAALESAVKALQEKATLPPPPTLPDNKKLRDDIVKGSASLTDTMQAMQLSARVQAAEKAVSTMAEMLTQLAASGALPRDIAAKAAEIQANIQNIRMEMTGQGKSGKPVTGKGPTTPGLSAASATVYGRKSVAIDPIVSQSVPQGMLGVSSILSGTSSVAPSQRSMKTSTTGGNALGGGRLSMDARMIGVTRPELDEGLQILREELLKILNASTVKATAAADMASATIHAVAEKMDMATKLNNRINLLNSLVTDYADQLAGFDTGLTSQMAGFQEQMAQMRNDLSTGLKQLEQVNNNAETAAVLELTERYESLVNELDSTLHSHQDLATYQRQLSDELKSLLECVEMMREQKADKDEVLDGLRDKADSSRLAGLLSDEQFQQAREELELRIQMCHDKFRKQDMVWMNVMCDFNQLADSKAELMDLLGAREEAQESLKELHWKTQQLARLLGDPKAAIITRQLAKDATCALCRVPALMEPEEPIRPISLPAARPEPTGASSESESEEPYVLDFLLGDRDVEDGQTSPHKCLRWVGGSHTLTAAGATRGNVFREKAAKSLALEHPVKRYLGYGDDGKLYKLEEDLQPCVECNQYAPEKAVDEAEKIPGEAELPSEDGGGDSAVVQRVTLVDMNAARRVTVVDDDSIPAIPDGVRKSTSAIDGARRATITDEAPRRATILEDGTVHLEDNGDGNTNAMETDANRLTPSRAENMSTFSQSVSAMGKASATAFDGSTSRRATEVGTVVKGRVTVIDEEAAERAAILAKIASDKSEKEAKEAQTTDQSEPLEAKPE